MHIDDSTGNGPFHLQWICIAAAVTLGMLQTVFLAAGLSS